ncbi:MAG TPA: hypothetical protein VG267_15415 [Terracidiphilus sp.]|jgi:hypothetical protein|nr:hypothetical protein [Terracidiphilus sp.]
MGEYYQVIRVGDKPSFSTKHRKVIMLLGAALVFATFVIKDALRDQQKDLSDFVGSARAVFIGQEDSSSVLNRLTLIRNAINRLAQTYPHLERMKGFDFPTVRPTYDEIDSAADELEAQREFISLYLDRSSHLCEVLPDGSTLLVKINDLKKRLEADDRSGEEIESFLKEYRSARSSNKLPVKDPEFIERSDAMGRQVVSQFTDLRAILTDAVKSHADVFESADAAHHKSRQYRDCGRR